MPMTVNSNGPAPPEQPPRTAQAEPLTQEPPRLVAATPPALASILVPCCGQLEYTKLCVPSLLRHTRKPFELIFIDIGSLDGTKEYLAGIADAAAQLRVEVVRTPTDLGIADAVQEALRRARGEFLVLVNNDTIVPHGWLNQLAGLARSSPTVGLVGPVSNYAAPPQLVEEVPYRIGARPGSGLVDTSAVDAFAEQWRQEHEGKWQQVERLGGFCLLVKREVLKRIGHLREAGDLALFDTDLLSARARQAGFTLACCRDLFVHHFGTRTFAHGAPRSEAGPTPAGLPGR
jgi:GT2 family glycosyltransferase